MNSTYIDEHIDHVSCDLKINSMAHFIQAVEEDLRYRMLIPHHLVKKTSQIIQDNTLCPIGQGISIPNTKIQNLDRTYSLLYVLDKGLACDVPDDIPVDIFCVLISPESHGGRHLQRLSKYSRVLKNNDLCAKIRDAKDADVIRALVSSPDGLLLAA